MNSAAAATFLAYPICAAGLIDLELDEFCLQIALDILALVESEPEILEPRAIDITYDARDLLPLRNAIRTDHFHPDIHLQLRGHRISFREKGLRYVKFLTPTFFPLPDLSVSTLADQVGACTAVLQPLHALIEAHVLAAERLHGDDTTVPVLARGKTVKGRIWTYVRDDRPFAGTAPPAALYYAWRDRRHEHPERHLRDFTGILQADAYSGYNSLYDPSRAPGAILPALCWAHARRQFFELADIAANARRGKNAPPISPVALEAVKRIDALFDIERAINGLPAEGRLRVCKQESAPVLTALQAWLREERARLSRSASVAQPIDYLLRRWDRFAGFLDDGRICLTNNAAERALRGFALGRKSWLFAGSERGADRAAAMATLIATAKLNDIDPQAWLADVLARIAGIPQSRLHELLPWNRRATTTALKAA